MADYYSMGDEGLRLELARQNERLRQNVSALAKQRTQLQDALALVLEYYMGELRANLPEGEALDESLYPSVVQARRALEETHYHGASQSTGGVEARPSE